MPEDKDKDENKPLVYIPKDVEAELNFGSDKLDPPKTKYDVRTAIYYERKSMEEAALRKRTRNNDY